MAAKDLQTLSLKFDQVMLNSLVFRWERNFEVTFGIFSVNVPEGHLGTCFKISYDQTCENCNNLSF